MQRPHRHPAVSANNCTLTQREAQQQGAEESLEILSGPLSTDALHTGGHKGRPGVREIGALIMNEALFGAGPVEPTLEVN